MTSTTVSRIPRIEQLSLDACIAMAHPRNPKEHDVPSLVESIIRFGFKAFPSIDEETKVMITGHGRCKALLHMRDEGMDPPDGIEVEGSDWRVPIIRGLRFANAKERDAYVIADNKQGERGGWNLDRLTEMLGGMNDSGFSGLGFDNVELQSFGLSTIGGGSGGLLEDGDDRDAGMPTERDEAKSASMVREIDAPPPPKEPITKLGDVWLLDRHVLVCGDSCADGVARAMSCVDAKVGMVWTDPPWNVAYGENPVSSRRERAPENAQTIMNDDLGKDFPEFVRLFVSAFTAVSDPGVAVYLAMSAQEYPMIDSTMRSAGWHWSSTIIWAKDALVLGRKDYHSRYEPLWYGWREGGPRKNPLRDRGQSDLWEIDRPRRSDEHPTMKPIRLVARAIENSSQPNDLILDPFGGSGTTLLAAEQVGRRAALVELDPRYADVIVDRWEKLTGGKAQRASRG